MRADSDGPYLYTEPIIGWRVWLVGRRGGAVSLLSWSQPDQWPAGRRMEARCLRTWRGGHDAVPRPRHPCGLYATRTRAQAEALTKSVALSPAPYVLGQVSLWGRVIENVGGWRAQYGYPYQLQLFRGDRQLADALRNEYVVDVALVGEPGGG